MNSECVLVNSECVLVLAVNHLSTIMTLGPCCSTRRVGVLAVVSEELVIAVSHLSIVMTFGQSYVASVVISVCIVVEMN